MAENDFQDLVFRDYPLLKEIGGALRDSGSFISLLSGSGAALFGLYEQDGTAAQAKEDLGGRFPNTRFIQTRTRFPSAGPQEMEGG